jgi:translation initiation factor 2 beta subunit (eIF-2beta)/eIF-5
MDRCPMCGSLETVLEEDEDGLYWWCEDCGAEWDDDTD